MRWLLAVAVLLAACSSGNDSLRGVTPPSPQELSVNVAGLPGSLLLPPGPGPFPAVVLVSGSGPNDRDETLGPNKPFRDLAQGLAARGVASLRYDKRTLVDKADIVTQLATFTPTDEYVPDAVAALDFVAHRPEIDPKRVFLLGHSQGGTFAPRIVAAAHTNVTGMILMAAGAAPFGFTLIRQLNYIAQVEPLPAGPDQLKATILKRQAAQVDNPHLSPTTPSSELLGGIGPPYWLDLSHYDAVATARSLTVPVLVLQGGRDYNVTLVDDLSRWQRGLAGRANVTFKQYPAANHFFIDGTGPSTPAEMQTAGHVGALVISDIAAWVLGTRSG